MLHQRQVKIGMGCNWERGVETRRKMIHVLVVGMCCVHVIAERGVCVQVMKVGYILMEMGVRTVCSGDESGLCPDGVGSEDGLCSGDKRGLCPDGDGLCSGDESGLCSGEKSGPEINAGALQWFTGSGPKLSSPLGVYT